MKVVIHDRTEELPARLRSYAERKLERLSRHFDRVLDAVVEFDRESRGRAQLESVEITVHLDGRRHPLARAKESAGERRAALDLALDKVDRQVSKFKEKIKVEKKRPAATATAPDGGLERHPAPERVRLKLRPETLEDVSSRLDAEPGRFRVYLDEDSGQVNVAYRKADGGVAVIEPVVP